MLISIHDIDNIRRLFVFELLNVYDLDGWCCDRENECSMWSLESANSAPWVKIKSNTQCIEQRNKKEKQKKKNTTTTNTCIHHNKSRRVDGLTFRDHYCFSICSLTPKTARRNCTKMPVRKYRRRTSEISCCLKYFIFSVNVLFWVSGLE